MDHPVKRNKTCSGCGEGVALDFDFTMAFQPVVDLTQRSIWGFEALVRGTAGESAGSILSRVNDGNRYKFDQACRVKAIELAGALFQGQPYILSINFMPNAVYEPSACIRTSLQAADRVGLKRGQLMFEFTENEEMKDTDFVKHIVEEYKRFGFITALDDFGAGYAGLTLLAAFQPNLIKIDMVLVRGIHADPVRQAIVSGIVSIARQLDIIVLAEGIEEAAEAETLFKAGITLMQGYYFGKPVVEALPLVDASLFGFLS